MGSGGRVAPLSSVTSGAARECVAPQTPELYQREICITAFNHLRDRIPIATFGDRQRMPSCKSLRNVPSLS
jgi:hypothetical protein